MASWNDVLDMELVPRTLCSRSADGSLPDSRSKALRCRLRATGSLSSSSWDGENRLHLFITKHVVTHQSIDCIHASISVTPGQTSKLKSSYSTTTPLTKCNVYVKAGDRFYLDAAVAIHMIADIHHHDVT